MLAGNIRKIPRELDSCPPCNPFPAKPAAGTETYDVVVVGAGFAGMYMLHRLRGQGIVGAGL